MGFRNESQISKSLKVSMLLVGLGVALSAARPAVAGDPLAVDTCKQQADDDKKALRDDERDWRKQLSDKQRLLGQLNSPTDIGDTEMFPGLKNDCDCRPAVSGGCTKDFWIKTMGVAEADLPSLDTDGSNGCVRIYEKYKGSLSSLQAAQGSCYARVSGDPNDPASGGCGQIKRKILIAQVQRDIRELQRQIKEDIPDRRKRIAEELKDCRHDCPTCGQQGYANMFKPREPNGWDYLLGGIQSITPMVLGGMGMYMNSQNLAAYTHNYSAYLGQCQAVGIPCGGPMMMGGMGGFGMGGFGMGGFGMPMMGMGGMGGMVIGGGIAIGGMGMGGFPMMGMGGMVIGGGLAMGGMGGMMMGGYPMMVGGYGMPMMGMPMMGMPMMGMPMGMGGMVIGGGIAIGGMGMGGLYPMSPMFTAGYGMPMYPYGTGFGSPLFPMGPIGGMGGMVIGGGIAIGGMGMGGFPMMGGMMGGYPMMGGMMMGGMPMVAPGGFMGPMGGYGGMAMGGMGMGGMVMGGMGMGGMAMGGMGMGGLGYGFGGGMNPQYMGMMQASMQQQMLQAQSAAQAQQDLMIAQQQIYQAQSRYYQIAAGGYGFGGGGMVMGGMGMGGGMGGMGGAHPF